MAATPSLQEILQHIEATGGYIYGNVLREILNFAAGQQMKAVIVDTSVYPTLESFLASTGQNGVIYLYPNDDTEIENNYDEYVWVEDEETYELVGKLQIEFSYEALSDKPSINDVELDGNMSLNDLGIQAALVSGTSIKTISGISLLSSGDIEILAMLGVPVFQATVDYKKDDVVVHNHTMRRFTADHAAGAWSDSDNEPVDLFTFLTDNVLPNLTAGDIVPKNDEPSEATNIFAIQTTGGDEDLKSGSAKLLSIRGNLDASLNPFLADTFVSTGMNLVDSSKVLTIGGKNAYYFPVKKGTWGVYGTAQENNGYIIITDGTVNSVYFKATKPTAESYGFACGKTTYGGKDYYTPSSDGWLIIIMDDEVVPACHVAWSNYNDEVAGTFGNIEKSISTAIQAIHTWGLAGLIGAEYSVFDELDFYGGHGYKRIDRAMLKDLSWSMTTSTDDNEVTTYIFTASISAMKSNGLWRAGYNGISISGNTLTITSTTITTVAALQTALDTAYIYYELASVTITNISNAATIMENTVNDFGLSYFLNNGELATVPAYVTEAFYQSGKDQLFNAVSRLALVEQIVAHAMNNLDKRMKALANKFGEPLADLVLLSFTGKRRKIKQLVGMFKRQTTSSPITLGIIPDYIGEECYDTTNKIKYEAFGTSAATDWVALNS